MSDLVSRKAVIEALRLASARPSSIDAVTALPAITPQVAANITGGILQGASSDYPVDLYCLDFETQGASRDELYAVEGSRCYIHQQSTLIDPLFVGEVIAAETPSAE